jgi:hypothetical protein
MWPYQEDVFRFDFEVDNEDEFMCQFGGSENGLLNELRK